MQLHVSPKNRQLKSLENRIQDVSFCAFDELVQLLDVKDLTTGEHSSRLATWANTICKLLGLSPDEARQVEIGAVLHDIGKIGIPDEILKKPARLTLEEQAVMREHPEYGWAVMKNMPGCEMASLLILHHHEMWNGEGYPAGLRGESIPLGARVVAIIDAFDAMTTDRCYRPAISVEKALLTLEHFSGTQFDAKLVKMFAEYVRSEQFQCSEVPFMTRPTLSNTASAGSRKR